MKHTKGPWKVQHRNNTFLKTIVTESRENFQSIGDCTEENCNLIAAAPDMLEALEFVRKSILDPHNETLKTEVLIMSDRAIKKAKGE